MRNDTISLLHPLIATTAMVEVDHFLLRQFSSRRSIAVVGHDGCRPRGFWIVSSRSFSRSRPDVHDPPLVAGLGISRFWVQSTPRSSVHEGGSFTVWTGSHCFGTLELAVRHRVLIRCAVSMGRAAPPTKPVRRQQRRDAEL